MPQGSGTTIVPICDLGGVEDFDAVECCVADEEAVVDAIVSGYVGREKLEGIRVVLNVGAQIAGANRRVGTGLGSGARASKTSSRSCAASAASRQQTKWSG